MKPGETVVVRGQLQLAPGTKVIVKEEAASLPLTRRAETPTRRPNEWQNRTATAGRNSGPMVPARARQNGTGEKAGPIFFRPFPAVHPTAGHDDAADGVDHCLRHPHLQATGGERSAGGRLSRHPGQRLLSGRESGNDGEHDRHAARETVHPNSRAELSTSSSTQGNTAITLQFDLSKSIDAAATDVQSAIQRASGQLPSDLPSPPTFTKTNPNDQPVIYIALTSDTLTDGELYSYATTQVQQRINILPGVSQVNVYGSKGAIRIKVDPGALASRNLTFDDLSAAIRAGTAYSGAGQFDGQNKSIILRPNGPVDDAEGYRNLIIARGPDNAPVYLRDVAKVVDGVAGRTPLAAFLCARF